MQMMTKQLLLCPPLVSNHPRRSQARTQSAVRKTTHAIAALILGMYLVASWLLKFVPPLIPPTPPKLRKARYKKPSSIVLLYCLLDKRGQ